MQSNRGEKKEENIRKGRASKKKSLKSCKDFQRKTGENRSTNRILVDPLKGETIEVPARSVRVSIGTEEGSGG